MPRKSKPLSGGCNDTSSDEEGGLGQLVLPAVSKEQPGYLAGRQTGTGVFLLLS